ncbi:5-carboxymethyl-2-hydroxymuconate semialdehyde dehydrogenase [Nocardioides sp. GXZ039]|uniref:5-carboxymethyl-2-hydroxymuconate semialdehyde dehydrogenase n=1 Tax=Nocardioides sp. GXZ039 TaxID=3136018 RepID=UPI0030F3CF59
MTNLGPSATVDARVPHDLPAQVRHLIDGRLLDSSDGATFEVLDPVTNEVYLHAAAGGGTEIELAVAAANRALDRPEWADLTARRRAGILTRMADEIEARGRRIAALETYDTGLPITQTAGQAARAAENFRFFADLIVGRHEEAYRVPGQQLNYVRRHPLGVAGLITPWNTPFMLESWKLAPALAAGCAVVLKPAEFTPLTASLWADIGDAAGLPPGVLNVVHGLGESAGEALVRHPAVPAISFTGESATGAHIFAAAAPELKALSMELGGKSPVVVFADADLPAALDAVVFGVFSLNGERCTAGSRVLVERAVYAEFCQRLAERAAAIRVGEPSDPETEVGALVHPEHLAKVLGYIEIGRSEGRLVAGGGRPEHLPEGNFVAPTVFVDVEPRARIFQEEIFGPVVAVSPFDDVDEALRLANDTRYGLAAYLWTRDLDRAHRIAGSLEAGMVWVNSHNVRDLRTPFGGIKASGVGREGGARSLDFYSEEQAIHVALGGTPAPVLGRPRHGIEGGGS